MLPDGKNRCRRNEKAGNPIDSEDPAKLHKVEKSSTKELLGIICLDVNHLAETTRMQWHGVESSEEEYHPQ